MEAAQRAFHHRRSFRIAVGTSCLLHVGVVLVLYSGLITETWEVRRSPGPTEEVAEVVSIVTLETPPAPDPTGPVTPPEPPKNDRLEPPPAPVVEVAQPPTPTPKEARFLARHDTTAPRDTRARRPVREPAAELEGESRDPSVEPSAQAEGPSPAVPTPSLEAAPPVPTPSLEAAPAPSTASPEAAPAVSTEDGALAAAPPVPAIEVSPPAAAPSPPASASEIPGIGLATGAGAEAPPEVAVGASTALNARASKVAAYLLEVRSRVRPHWHPQAAYRTNAGSSVQGDHTTSVDVRIAADGRIASASIAASSGQRPLDVEAVAALRRAQPFTAPPPDIADAEGAISFRFNLRVDARELAFIDRAEKALYQLWHQSPSFYHRGDRTRMAVIRALLTFEGQLVRADIVASTGLGFLDKHALEAVRALRRWTPPPPSFGEIAGLVPVRIEAVHRVRADGHFRVRVWVP